MYAIVQFLTYCKRKNIEFFCFLTIESIELNNYKTKNLDDLHRKILLNFISIYDARMKFCS